MLQGVYKLSPSTKLYRSSSSLDTLINGGYWYSFAVNEVIGYGPITGEFSPIRQLTLLDITSNEFYEIYLRDAREAIKRVPELQPKLARLLFPIGFTDSDVYKTYALSIPGISYNSPSLNVLIASQYYHNRSRCSIKEFDIDFVELVKHLYKDKGIDGIIAPDKLPNTIMNGLHHSEICVFDKTNVVFKQIAPRHSGGAIMESPKTLIGISLPHLRKESEETRKIIIEHADEICKIAGPIQFYTSKSIWNESESTGNIPIVIKRFRKTRKARRI